MRDFRGPLARGLQLAGLFSLALAQPLLELLQRHPPFLVAHRAGLFEIAGLVAFLLIAIPAAAWLLEELLARVGPALAIAQHLAWVGVLVAATALPFLGRELPVPGGVALALALAIGLSAVAAWARFSLVRRFTSALALAPLIFVWAFASDASIGRLLASPLPAAETPGAAGFAVPVVLVVFDELPTTSLLDAPDHIDPIRYPAFARLSREALWFRRASGVHALTEHAIPAILTGRYPDPSQLPIASDHPRNLFRLLGGEFEMNVEEPFTSLFQDPRDESWGRRLARARSLIADLSVIYLHVLLPRDLAASLPPVSQAWSDFTRASVLRRKQERTGAFSDRPGRFRDFVASIQPGEGPALHFVHIPLPHVPWQHGPSGRIYYPPTDFDFWDNTWGREESWVVQGYQRHLMQLELVDTLLGELLERLEATGLYDRALLIVVADHGASFRPGESRRDPASMQHPEDVLGVPLFVKPPGQRQGRVSHRNVETVDILPTIADVVGIEIPWEIDGCSLLDPDCPERLRKTMFSRDDVRLSFDPALLDRTQSLDRKLALFGSGAREDGLFRAGPHAGWVGLRVADLPVEESANARVQLMERAFERANDHPEAFSLARVTGVLDRNPTGLDPPQIALALDGRVRAVAPALARMRGGYLFSAMLPESAYAPGVPLTLFLIDGRGESRVLRPIPYALGDLPNLRGGAPR